MAIHIESKHPMRRRRISRANLAQSVQVARARGQRILFDGSGLPKGQSLKVVILSAPQRSNDQSAPTG